MSRDDTPSKVFSLGLVLGREGGVWYPHVDRETPEPHISFSLLGVCTYSNEIRRAQRSTRGNQKEGEVEDRRPQPHSLVSRRKYILCQNHPTSFTYTREQKQRSLCHLFNDLHLWVRHPEKDPKERVGDTPHRSPLLFQSLPSVGCVIKGVPVSDLNVRVARPPPKP